MDVDLLSGILLALLFSALFSGLEIAIVSSNLLQIEVKSIKGKLGVSWLAEKLKQPVYLVGTMLLGNTVALVVYGEFMSKWLSPLFSQFISGSFLLLLTITLVSTIVVLIFAEFLPKVIFRRKPNRILNQFKFVLMILYTCLIIPTRILLSVSNFILTKILRLDLEKRNLSLGRVDLTDYITKMSSSVENESEIDTEIKLLQNALDFKSVKARQCVVPRNEITGVDINEPVDSLVQMHIDTGYSKIIVYRENMDQIIGYTHAYDLFTNPPKIESVLKPVLFVPESMPANELLGLMLKEQKNLAVVLDEFGGTHGILTMEDIIEEIFGEIKDEHDRVELLEKQVSDKEFMFSARHEIDYVNEKYELNLPESPDYETIAGLLLSKSESIPVLDEKIRVEHLEFTVKSVLKNKIDLVQIIVLDTQN